LVEIKGLSLTLKPNVFLRHSETSCFAASPLIYSIGIGDDNFTTLAKFVAKNWDDNLKLFLAKASRVVVIKYFVHSTNNRNF